MTKIEFLKRKKKYLLAVQLLIHLIITSSLVQSKNEQLRYKNEIERVIEVSDTYRNHADDGLISELSYLNNVSYDDVNSDNFNILISSNIVVALLAELNRRDINERIEEEKEKEKTL